jgi:Domain of unknown function (DUF4342)
MTEQLNGGSATDPRDETTAFGGASSVRNALADTQKEVVDRIRPAADDLMARGRELVDKGNERIKPAADDLMARGRELVDKGNERRLIIEHNDRAMVDLPLTVAAALGFVATIISPTAAVLGVLAALFTRVRVRIEQPNR